MTASVCFTGMTALRILRAAKPSDFEPVVRRSRLPNDTPTKRLLDAAVESLRAAYPALLPAGAEQPSGVPQPSHPSFDALALTGGKALPCIDVATSSGSRRRAPKGYAFHFCASELSSGMMLRLDNRLLVASPALALMQVAARCRREMPLLKLIWEICGTYQTELTAPCSAYETLPLASLADLLRARSLNSRVHGSRRLGRVLRFSADGSASPRETMLALLLGMPMHRGGYGLGIPHMNWEVAATDEARKASGRSSFRCDLCWPEAWLDVEYQSREMHGNEPSRIDDSKRANALASMNWKVIWVTNGELESYAATESVVQAIRRHLGKPQRVSVENYSERKLKLRRELGLPSGYAAHSLYGMR